MSEALTSQEAPLALCELPAELQQVIKHEKLEPSMNKMLFEIYQNTKEPVKEIWNALPQSAQNILDNFEQFLALASLSQAYTGIDFYSQVQDQQFKGMTEEQTKEYKEKLLEELLFNSLKDLGKNLKKARLKPNMKREYREFFAK